jgi:hypothetical protein
MKLYEVRLKRLDVKNSDHAKFITNCINLGHTEPSYSSLQQGLTLLSHPGPESVVLAACSLGIRKKSAIEVSEVTKKTWTDSDSPHSNYEDVIQKRFLPSGNYPNL